MRGLKTFYVAKFFKRIFLFSLLLSNIKTFSISTHDHLDKLAPKSITSSPDQLTLDLKIRDILNDYYDNLSSIGSNVRDKELLLEEASEAMVNSIYISSNEEQEQLRSFVRNIKAAHKTNETNFTVSVSSNGIDFSMISQILPDKAVLMDINPAVVKGYIPLLMTLICLSENRAEFLSLFSGRLLKRSDYEKLNVSEFENILKEDNRAGKENIKHQLLESIPEFFPKEYHKLISKILLLLQGRKGWNQLKELLDKMNFEESYLASEENFNRLKTAILDKRIIGVHMDLGSPFHTKFKAFLSNLGIPAGLYFSNVYDHLRSSAKEEQFFRNIIREFSLKKGSLSRIIGLGSQLPSKGEIYEKFTHTFDEIIGISG